MSANSSEPSMLCPPLVPIDLGLTYGALLVGSLIGAVLWGVQVLQTVWYYVHYPADSITVKLFVAVLNVVGTTDSVIGVASIWQGAIRNSGLPPDIFTNPLLFVRIPISGIVALFAQSWFVYRIFQFADVPLIKYGVPVLLAPLVIFQLVGNSIVAGTWLHTSPGSNPLLAEVTTQNRVQKYIIGLYSSTCAADIIIAFVMCYLLYRRRTGLRRTDRLLTNLALASINTGSWTAFDSILIVILTTSTPSSTFLFAAPNFCFSSLYINTVLCNLNVRQFFRVSDRTRQQSKSSVFSNFKLKPQWGAHFSKSDQSGTIQMPHISVDTARQANTYELASNFKANSEQFDASRSGLYGRDHGAV